MDASKVKDVVAWINRAPSPLRPILLSRMVGLVVPYVATTGLVIESMSADEVTGKVPRRKRSANHIGGVHAVAAMLLAETVTGFLVAMNLPRGRLPLLKSLEADFTKRSRGAIRARAWLDENGRERIATEPKGRLEIPVELFDESGRQPMTCKAVWAWVPAGKKAS
ncbi:MAG: DUF4442 domain-containing protein [Deltaproteobacteria bacterium]|nr:MAG: DUF4442 domain-containing protein [Deltaproteobacteria bacterium]